MTSLSNQQKLFCQEYLKLGMNGTQAYLNVYKSVKKEATARTNASRLLTNANIQEYIKELQEKVEEKAVVTIEDIVNELSVIAFGDRTEIAKYSEIVNKDPITGTETRYCRTEITPTDKLSKNAKKMIAGYKKSATGINVETYDKIKALELLGKYLGMWSDVNLNNNINLNYENILKKVTSKSEY